MIKRENICEDESKTNSISSHILNSSYTLKRKDPIVELDDHFFHIQRITGASVQFHINSLEHV